MPPGPAGAAALVALLGLVLLGAVPVRAQMAAPENIPPYHPLLGMEPSGRIPKALRPEDLPNADRWRYVPEGRIKEGSALERLFVSSFIAPQFFFEEDVGFGGGIALTDIDFRTQRRREFLGGFFTYTTEGQQSYRLLWRRWLHHRDLPEGGVLFEERSWLGGGGGYQKTLTRRFFGIGPDTRADDETSYTDELWIAGVGGELALPEAGGDWVASLSLRGEHHNLSAGRVSGRPTTDQAFPALFAEGDAYSALTLSAGLRWDTRDSQHNPYRGWRVGVGVDAPLYQSTGEVAAIFSGVASVAIPLPPLFHKGGDPEEENPPTDTLALGVEVNTTAGAVPFYRLPSLGGGQMLRGFIQNRFTDDSAWHASAEYRFWLVPRGIRFTDLLRIERLGLAAFVEAGSVAGSLGDLLDATVHTSYGLGFRMMLERAALFRVDLGFSREGSNLSIGFGLSF
jgi:hypothetical protein